MSNITGQDFDQRILNGEMERSDSNFNSESIKTANLTKPYNSREKDYILLGRYQTPEGKQCGMTKSYLLTKFQKADQ